MHNKTLREIYEYDLIPDDGLNFPIEEWFNAVMEKTEDKLTVADVSRMLRQKIFSVVAINRAIEMLKDDIFTGEMYEDSLWPTSATQRRSTSARDMTTSDRYLQMSESSFPPVVKCGGQDRIPSYC